MSPRKLLIEPVNGLCNRLRAIASGWILSLYLNREFAVIWNSTEDIGFTHFTDLFEKTDWLIDEHDIPNDCTIYVSGVTGEVSLIPKLCNDNSTTIFLKQTGGNYSPPNIDIQKYNTLKSHFYNTLIPVSDIITRIQAFSNKIDINTCLGVHIRRTDRKKITPNTDTFALAIKRVSNDNTIFLCTDDEREISNLKNLIPNKIVTYPKKRFARNTSEDVKEALIEWILLSRCNNMIYSHGSSFGYEACVCGKLKTALELRSKREKSDNEKRNMPVLTFCDEITIDWNDHNMYPF